LNNGEEIRFQMRVGLLRVELCTVERVSPRAVAWGVAYSGID
jgi:hypothetical protein